jgi:hypothetical protein
MKVHSYDEMYRIGNLPWCLLLLLLQIRVIPLHDNTIQLLCKTRVKFAVMMCEFCTIMYRVFVIIGKTRQHRSLFRCI